MEDNGSFLNTGYLYSNPQYYTRHDLPTPSIDIPTKLITGRIRRINYTENPISIIFDNGTHWSLVKKQWEYLTQIGCEPKEGLQFRLELFLDGTIKSVTPMQLQ